MTRVSACLVAFLLTSATFCARAPKPAPAPAAKTVSAPVLEDVSRVGSLEIRREDYPTVPLLKVPVADAPAHVRSLYRIKPDRRILYALAEIPRILSGKERGPLTLRLESGAWKVSLAGEPVGTLPEIPEYEDARKLLGAWAARQLQVQPLGRALDGRAAADLAALEPELTSGDSKRTMAALRKLNEHWRAFPAAPELLRAAARGFTWLSVQLIDDLDQAESLLGRALAFVVLSDVSAPGAVMAEEAILCAELGYETAARALANSLPRTSPERAYLLEEEKALAGLAKQSSKDAGTPYLDALLAGRQKRLSDLEKPPDGASLSSVKPWHRGRNFSNTLAVEDFILSAVWGEAGLARRGAAEAELGTFERQLAGRARAQSGPVLEAESYSSFYRGAAYTATHEKARYLLEDAGVTDSAEQYVASFDAAPGTAAELRRYLLDKIACRRDRARVQALNEGLDLLARIGLVPLAGMQGTIAGRTGAGRFAQRKGMPGLFRRLDSRPSALSIAANAARWNLHDLDLEESCLRALDRAARDSYIASSARLGLLKRDADMLRELAHRESARHGTGPWGRSQALEYLADVDRHSSADVLSAFKRLVDESPNLYGPLMTGIQILEDKLKAPERALELVRYWRSRWTKERDLYYAQGVVDEAALLRRLGRAAEAHRTVQEVVPTWKQSALAEAASCLLAQNRLEDALDMARRCLERYPEGSGSYAMLAEVLWRMDRDDEAAEAIATGLPSYGSGGSATIGDAFTRAFEGRSLERTANAVSALSRAGLGGEFLLHTLMRLSGGNDHRKAFEILKTAPLSGEFASAARIDAYKELVKVEGAEAGLAWMRSVTPAYDSQLAIVLVQWGPHELLLDLFAGNPQAEKQDPYLNMRAATLVYLRRGNDPRRDEVLRALHERQKGRHDAWLTTSSRFLLHEVDETAIPKEFGYPGYISAIGWTRGLRAAEARRYREANAWFQVALEADQEPYPPRGFAFASLYRWQEAGKSLDLLAAEGKL